MTTQPERNTHAAVEKALQILKAFAPHNERIGPVALSRKLGVHPSTTTRLLKVLKKHGFVEQDPETRKYYLGRSNIFLAQAVIESLRTDLVSIVRPYVDGLRDRVNESVGLEVWAGDTTTLAYIAPGPQLVQISAVLGARMPVHVAAGARAIMAHLPPEVVDDLLDGALRRFTSKTLTDPKAIKRKLVQIRRTGVSVEQGELDEDVYIMAAPVFNHAKSPVAAVAIAVPAYRMKSHMRRDTVRVLKETAARISVRLYCTDESQPERFGGASKGGSDGC
jgi:DNA-binding IclR family transcriptional regulator